MSIKEESTLALESVYFQFAVNAFYIACKGFVKYSKKFFCALKNLLLSPLYTQQNRSTAIGLTLIGMWYSTPEKQMKNRP
jgi:hypothetical protein